MVTSFIEGILAKFHLKLMVFCFKTRVEVRILNLLLFREYHHKIRQY